MNTGILKRIPAAALLLLLSLRLDASPLEVRRFGIFIGANNGGRERQRLLYAGDDARKMARTMYDVGGISEEDGIILLDPSARDIREELHQLSLRVRSAERRVRRTELMFYYSGHSDEQGLMVREDQIPYREIRRELEDSGADVVVAVLDSCSSGAITRIKGGRRRSPFLIDESSSMEGHAFLTSSSEDELSQESDRIGASFFTHYLISGLRGAADSTGDGRVTLNEIYQHTFDETLAQTESTVGGPQHPAYEIQLTGTGDLVLTDLTVPSSALQLSGELEGRFAVRTAQGRLVAEFTKLRGNTLKLALPAGSYTIHKTPVAGDRDMMSEQLMSTALRLNRNAQIYLTAGDFEGSELEPTRFRGETEEPGGDRVFVFSPLPDKNIPEIEDTDRVVLQGGLIGAEAPRVEGAQISFFYNRTERESLGAQTSLIFNSSSSDFTGFQGSYVYNWAGSGFTGLQSSTVFNYTAEDISGFQAGGVFNIGGGALKGVQAASIFNRAGMPSTGFQAAGIFNTAKELRGVQTAGIFNHSSYIEGAQISLINIAGTSHGSQIGLVNIAREMYGAPLGLINISRNGIMDGGLWYEYSGEPKRLYLSYQSGSDRLYTLLYWGNGTRDFFNSPDEMAWGLHLGTRLSLGPLDLDLDTGIKQCYADIQDGDSALPVHSARAIVALKWVGIYWGVTMDFRYPGQPDSDLFSGKSLDFGTDGRFRGYYRFVAGIRI